MKKLLSCVLCTAMLCTMLIFGASAADAVPLSGDPAIKVGLIEGEKVKTLEFCFGADLPFTGFDAAQKIELNVVLTPPAEITLKQATLTRLTAEPTAYDAETGTLTAKLLDHKGEQGVALHQLTVTMDFSAIEGYESDNAVVVEDAWYTFDVTVPAGLLTGDSGNNAAYTFSTKAVKGLPVLTECVYTAPAWFNQVIGSKIVQKIGEVYGKLKSGSVLRRMMNLAIVFVSLLLMAPSMLNIYRAMKTSLIRLSGIGGNSMFQAVRALLS